MSEVLHQLRDMVEKLKHDEDEITRYAISDQAKQHFLEIEERIKSGDRNLSDQEAIFHLRIWSSETLKLEDVRAALWIKRCALLELATSLETALELGQILISFILLRPILEHIAMVSWFRDEFSDMNFDKSFEPMHKTNFSTDALDDMAWIKIKPILAKRLFSKSSDIKKTLSNDLRPNKDQPWRPRSGIIDQKSEHLSKSIMLLSKNIEGVIRVYQLASEFAHPNQAVGIRYQESGFEGDGNSRIFAVGKYSRKKGGQLLEPKLMESVLIAIDALDFYLRVEREIMTLSKKAQKQAIDYIRKNNRYFEKLGIPMFSRNDACPCLSGKVFGNCCGR